MHIRVMYRDGKIGWIESYELDALISSNKIKKFQRSGKWVTIGVDPIRQVRTDYSQVIERKKISRDPKRK